MLPPLVLALFGAACGHIGFEELPIDATNAGDSGSDSAKTETEGGNNPDAATDGGDGGVLDGPCVGPRCDAIYVSEALGDDGNPGTAEKPVKTITKGISLATQDKTRTSVLVAGGTYAEKVTIVDRVSMFGGYLCRQAPCAWSRDVAKNDTSLFNKDFEGVLAPKSVLRRTLFDGFHVIGKDGTPASAPGIATMTLDGGTPTIRGCVIDGASSNGGPINGRRTAAIAILGATNSEGALLVSNTIHAGESTDESVGVLLDGKIATVGNPSATLVGNTIHGGGGTVTVAVLINATAPTTELRSNVIFAGKTNNSAATSASWGVSVFGGPVLLDGNRINHDPQGQPVGECTGTTSFCGGVVSRGAVMTMENNIVFGVKGPRTTAVLLADDDGGGVSAVVVNGNSLDGSGLEGSGDSTSSAIALHAFVNNGITVGKITNNILRGGLNKNRFGVLEVAVNNKTAHPESVQNNDFWNPPPARTDFAYQLWNGVATTTMTFNEMTTQLVTPSPSNNLSADPLLDLAMHLSQTSPCIDKGLGVAPARDIDGEKRPKGTAIDIGADEAR